MHKNIGKVRALYPMPVTILGTAAEGKVNWINIAHVGIIAFDKILVSVNKNHYSNQWIKKNKELSINLVSEEMLNAADYVGIYSGATTDKSEVFDYYYGELQNAPIIKNAPIAMECILVDNYDTETHDHFILEIKNTYADENVLTQDGAIDYLAAKPLLFEMSQRTYLVANERVGKCWSDGKQLIKKV